MMWWIAQNLVVTALLAGVVWVVCKTTRIGPAARHALWLLVLIKIVTPPLVVWPWAVPDLLAAIETHSNADNEAAIPVVTVEPTRIDHADSFIPIAGIGDSYEVPMASVPTDSIVTATEQLPVEATCPEPPLIMEAPLATSQSLSSSQDVQGTASGAIPTTHQHWSALLLQVGVTVWLVGAVLFAMIQAVRIARMSLRLRDAGQPNELVARQIATISKRLQMKQVEASIVAGIGSPFVWAFARPRLLWPAELPGNLSQPALQGLIVHELAHVKRRDHWVGWLELVAGCIWWWNPLFWYVRHQLRENAELACDAWVVGTLPTGRRAYAEALLAVCECVSKLTAPIPAVGATASGRHAIERRLNMILRGQSPFRLSRGGSLAAVVLAATALPAWSQHSEVRGYATESGDVVHLQGRSADWQPGELRVLLARYEEQEAELRREAAQQAAKRREALIKELQTMQDQFAREGLLDEAVAVRDQIRKLSTQLVSTISIDDNPAKKTAVSNSTLQLQPLPPGKNPLSFSDPGSLFNQRDRVGAVLAFDVVGSTDGSVWGSGIYTDDSDIGTAAVHAGLLQAGQRDVLYVAVMPGMSSYEGSKRNGVNSSSYQTWPGSYRFVLPPEGVRLGFKAIGRDCAKYRGEVGKTISIPLVIGDIDGPVWGSGVYTDDSSIGAAAVHAGILKPGEAGSVLVKILPGREKYEGSTENGVTSRGYGPWQGSFEFVRGKKPLKLRDDIRNDANMKRDWKPKLGGDVSEGSMGPPKEESEGAGGFPGTGSLQFETDPNSADFKATLRDNADVGPNWMPKVGDEVSVEWGNRWWKATVLELPQDGEFKIHYEGYGDKFDEVVPRERVRQPGDEPVPLEPTSGFHFNRTIDFRC